jgi:predicted dehydrogenase
VDLVRVGIVGSGGMAEYHVKKFSALPGVVVAGCCDRQAARAREFAARLRIPRWFGSAFELAGSSLVDCLATAVVDAGHATAALAALDRRLPLFAEKPLARTLAEASTLRDAAAAAGVPAMVNFSKRNAGALAAARRLVAEGRIGAVRGGSFTYLQSWLLQDSWGKWDETPRWRWRLSPSLSTCGVLGDLGSHVVDALLYVTGQAVSGVRCAVTALTPDPDAPGSPGAPDSFCASLSTTDGALFSARGSWRAPGFIDTFAFQLEGEKGTISADLAASRDAVRVFDGAESAARMPRNTVAALRASAPWSETAGSAGPSTYELFIDAVRARQAARPDFADGLAVQRIIDACSRSAREAREVAP